MEFLLQGGESLIGTIRIAVLPIAKVFTICFMGFLMASKYVNILPANGRKLLDGGNIGNVPLVLIAALCRDKENPFGDYEKCSRDGNAYISFGQWVGAIVVYTYVFHMLAPPREGTFDVQDGNIHIKTPNKDSHPMGSSTEKVPLLTTAGPSSSTEEKSKSFFKLLYEKLKLKQIIQPPIIASILAIIIGCVPVLRRLIFTSDAPFYFFTDSCLILGDAMIPCILLALGGNLVNGPGTGSAKLGLKTTAAIIFGRLLLVPPTGLSIVMLADKLGFLPPDDKMFRFVLLLQHTMPTSVLSGAVANLRGCGKEAASILFWVHIFAVFSMAGWITLYLNILF